MGLLDLPQELRDLIYKEVVIKDNNTITMLPIGNHNNTISACPPGICAVNQQIRRETLPTFYGANLFSAQLDNEDDLEMAKSWLTRIGEENIRHLRRLSFGGYSRVSFGHKSCRVSIRVVLDLKQGTLELEDEDDCMSAIHSPLLRESIEEVKAAYLRLFRARIGEAFDAESVERLMQEFNSMCTGW